MSRLLLALWVTLCFGCRSEGPPEFSEEDRLLEQLMESYVSERFEFYPVESTLAGFPGNDDRLGSYARADIDRRVAWLTDFHFRLMGLELTSLSRPSYLDALWLTSLVKAELFELSERRLWAKSASFYASRTRLGLFALLVEGDLDEREDALLGRLDEVVQVMSQARENLGPSAPTWHRDGLRSLADLQALLRSLPQLIGARLPAASAGAWKGRQQAAEAAVSELASRLPELQGQEGPHLDDVMVGATALEAYFRSEHLVDRPLAELDTLAREALASASHQLRELALTAFPSQGISELLTAEVVDSPDALVQKIERLARPFALDRSSATTGSLPSPYPVRLAPSYFPGNASVLLWRPRALEPKRGAFLLVKRSTSLGPASPSELELMTLREVGGRARQHLYQAESASLLRRVVVSPTSREAWLGRFERMALDEGFGADDPRLRLVHLHRRMLDLLRLIGVLDYHRGHVALEEIGTMFERDGYLPPTVAVSQAERIAVDLDASTAGLAVLLMDELESDYRRRHPLNSAGELTLSFLRSGSLPMRLIRFELLEPVPTLLLD